MEINTRVFVITDMKKKDNYLKWLPEKLICCNVACFRDNLQKILSHQKYLKGANSLTPVTIVIDREQIMDLLVIRSFSKKLKLSTWSILFYEVPIEVYGNHRFVFKLPEIIEVM